MRVQCIACLLLFGMSLLQAQEPQPTTTDARRLEARQRELDNISAVVKGRCIDGVTGAPLAGCKVKVDAWGGRRDEALPENLLKPDAVTTGDDGRFQMRVLAREDFQVGFDASLEGRWPRTGRWRHLVPGESEDVGDVKLYPGVRAVGKVVDETGAPVPNVMVGIDSIPLFLGSETAPHGERPGGLRVAGGAPEVTRVMHFAANRVRWARSAADGVFTSKEALPSGVFELRINNPEFGLLEPKQVTIPEQGPMQPITIVVQQPPYLGGVVVDETGAPVKGISLQAQLHRSGRMASAHTRDDGTFRIYRVENCPDTARIQIDDPGPCERGEPTEQFAWGKHDIRIELRRALTVDVVVVVAGTGEPVEDFAIRCYPTGGGMMSSLDQRLRMSGRHDGGKLRVEGVKRGAGRFAVVPRDPMLRCTQIDFTGEGGMAPLRVALVRMVPKMVQVLDAKGKPVAKATVQVIEPGNRQKPLEALVDPRGDGLGAFSSDPTVRFDELLHRATTDEGGQCIVYGIDGRADLVLQVRQDLKVLGRVGDVSFGGQHGSQQVVLDEK